MCIYFLSLAICQLIESWMGVLAVYTQHWLCTHRHTQMRSIGRGEIRWCFQTKQTASWKINILAPLWRLLCSLFLRVPTQKEAATLIQSFFDATARPCLVSIDQQRFFSHVTYVLRVIKNFESPKYDKSIIPFISSIRIEIMTSQLNWIKEKDWMQMLVRQGRQFVCWWCW